MKRAYGCTDAEVLRQSWAWLAAQVHVLRDAEREARAWQLKCAVATAAAGLPDGQQYLADLWDSLQASAPPDPVAEAAAVEQAQAQARLDGLVRQVKVSRDAD